VNRLGSEELFEAVFERLPLASFSCDAEGVVVAWNEAAERLYGYKKEDAVRCKIVELIATPDSNDEGLISQVFSGEELSGVKRSRLCADGRRLEVLTTFFPLRDLQGKVNRVVFVENKTTDLSIPQGEMVQSGAMYRVLTESALMGVYIYNQGRFLYVNEQMARVTGYSVAELLEMNPCELVHPDDMKGILKNRTEAFQRNVNQYILRIRRKNGEIAFLEIMTRRIQYGDKFAYLGNCLDVTERILVEKEGVEYIDDLTFLSETAMGFVELTPEEDIYRFIAEQLRRLTDKGFVVVSSFDAVSEKVTVRELLGDEKDMKGLSKLLGGEVVGTSYMIDKRGKMGLTTGKVEKVSGGLFELSFQKIPQEITKAVEESLGLGEIYAIGFSRKDEILGSVAILLPKNAELKNKNVIEAFVHQASVALQRRRAEEALRKAHGQLERKVEERTAELARANKGLRESEEKYRSIVERSNDGITIVQDDVLKYVNPRLAQMLGYTCDEMVNTSFTLYMDPEEVPKLTDRYKRRMAGEDVPSIYESITRHKDGHRIYVELNVGIVTYEGRPAEFVFVRDITARKRAEEALRASEWKYHQLVDNLHEGIWVIDKDSFTTFVNPRMAQMLGYTEEEMQGRHLFSFMDERWVQICKSYLERRRQGIKEEHEFEFMRKDGTRIYALLDTSPITDDEGNYMGASAAVRDITERKRTEEALQESEEKYRNIVECSNDGITIVQDDLLKYVNPRLAQMLGYTCEKMVNTSFIPYLDPEEVPKLTDRYKRRMAGEDVPSIYESITRHKDGSRIYVELNVGMITYKGKPAEFVFVRDITERKRTEEALRESEARYRLLAENATDVIFTMDTNLQFTYLSPSVTNLTGYEVEEAMALELEEFLIPSSLDEVTEVLTEELAVEEIPGKDLGRSRMLEFEIKRKDGSTICIEAKATFLRDKQDQVIGILGVARDVTERKRAEEEVKRHSRELSTLLEVSTQVSTTLDEEEVARLIAQRAAELIGADGCTIYRFDPQTEMLIPKTTTILQDREQRLTYHISLGEGITGKAALERRPITFTSMIGRYVYRASRKRPDAFWLHRS
jgi:PAS domain S-box-containing protein